MVSDRMFAPGGDSVPGGRLEPGRAPYLDRDTSPRLPSSEAAAVGVARRLQARLDRHQWLLGQLKPEPPQLRELSETVRRMRRDVESIVFQSGEFWPGAYLSLTQRESEVLGLMVRGLSNRAIGQGLFIGEETVKSHSQSIYRKLDVSDRSQAIAVALREGIFHYREAGRGPSGPTSSTRTGCCAGSSRSPRLT